MPFLQGRRDQPDLARRRSRPGGGHKSDHGLPLACKSWADRVPQCAPGVPPRKIFRRGAGPSALILGSLLHGCYKSGTVPAAAGRADAAVTKNCGCDPWSISLVGVGSILMWVARLRYFAAVPASSPQALVGRPTGGLPWTGSLKLFSKVHSGAAHQWDDGMTAGLKRLRS